MTNIWLNIMRAADIIAKYAAKKKQQILLNKNRSVRVG